MINTTTETLITVDQARDEFPQRPSIATVWRWILKGVSGTVLESVLVGGRRFTSKEACHRFIQDRSQPVESKPSKQERRQSFETARTILDHYGV